MVIGSTPARLVIALLGLASACTREPARVAVAVGVPDGLVRALLREFATDQGVGVDTRRAGDAAADLLWERTPETVLQLAARGAVEAVPGTDGYGRPPSMIDPERRWIATSAVARALVYDPARVADADAPTALLDLSRPEIARQLVLADPAHGDAAWHAAALFAALGESRALEFYRALSANGAQLVGDEAAVVAALLAGQRPIALTNSDRAFAAQEQQPTLVISFPDQRPDGSGVFLLPAVLGITRQGAANPLSRALLDFLLSAPVTRRIALAASSVLVLNDPGEVPAVLLGINALRVMAVSYADLAARLPAVRAALTRLAVPA